MTHELLLQKETLKALRLGVKTNSFTVLLPAQALLLQELLEERRPTPKPSIQLDKNCRACKFWHDPGRLAPFSYCTRHVLSDHDILTPVENALLSEFTDYLYVPEDFLCNYFVSKAPFSELPSHKEVHNARRYV